MAYNTSHLQHTLETWKRQSGREIDAKLQRLISPMGFEHINFNGVIVFPFEHYRTQFLSPRSGFRSRRSGVIGRFVLAHHCARQLGTTHYLGQHSIRVNQQWRVCFVSKVGEALDVEIVNHH